MDFRPRQPEPELGGGGPVGVGLEVEFDSKFTDAYANLDDVRDHNYHLARSPERMASTTPVYMGGLPNTATKEKIEKKTACRSCVLQSLLAVLFVAVAVGLSLAGFNLANTWSIGSITGVPPADTTIQVEQLLEELLKQLQEELLKQLQEELRNSTTTTVAPLPPECTISILRREHRCSFLVTSGSIDLQFATCRTTPTHLESPRGIFCTVSADQEMPLGATLIPLPGDMWTCRCHLIHLPNILQDQSLNFNCEMHEISCSTPGLLP